MIIIQKHLEIYGIITKISLIITDSRSFKYKIKITGITSDNGNTKDI